MGDLLLALAPATDFRMAADRKETAWQGGGRLTSGGQRHPTFED